MCQGSGLDSHLNPSSEVYNVISAWAVGWGETVWEKGGVVGGGALRYGLAIICRTTLGSGGGGRDSKAEIGGW